MTIDEFGHTSQRTLGRGFRKGDVESRRVLICSAYDMQTADISGFGEDSEMMDRADVMVEYAIGYMAVPLGVAPGFLIDGVERNIPMATEEPSVIAAAAFAGNLISAGGGFDTTAGQPLMTAQVYLKNVSPEGEQRIAREESAVRAAVAPVLSRMENRGGGLNRISVKRLKESGFVRVQLHVDVRDAMGANILNSAAEAARSTLEQLTGGTAIMAILSNSADERVATARFLIPVRLLARGRFSGEQVAAGVVDAWRIANEDEDRAVTHNKGIMNGVSALALATGNDTRGIEAAAHAFAMRSGSYRPLSRFTVEEGKLSGSIEIPAPFGVVGGAVGFHPGARAALKILGEPNAGELGRIAAALGLAQNLAALSALVSEGIQRGHMRLHARRVAFEAGARGSEVADVAKRLQSDGNYSEAHARLVLEGIRHG